MDSDTDVEKLVYRVIVAAVVALFFAAVLASLDDIKRELRIMRM